MTEQILFIGKPVSVTRQHGKEGIPFLATGKILRFSGSVLIGGEKTALVEYDDGDSYYHKLSEIKNLTNDTN